MIGFCSLGNINEHLDQFEQSLSESGNTSENQSPKLAKSDGIHGEGSFLKAAVSLHTVPMC